MSSDPSLILGFLLRPFVAWMILASIIGQVVKTQVFTRKRAFAKGRLQSFWWWGRKTMALHAAAAGAVIGLLWPGTIEAGYEGGTVQGVLYFATAGGLSVWLFEVAKGLAKKKGIDLKLPGESKTPPAPPEK